VDLTEALSDPQLGEGFAVTRTVGQFGAGGWQVTSVSTIQMSGVISIASSRDVDTLPEADRVHEMIVINSLVEIFVTSADKSNTSDVVNYQGKKFRVLRVFNYASRGYWWAIAGRTQGS
jgi:hypothetical protein